MRQNARNSDNNQRYDMFCICSTYLCIVNTFGIQCPFKVSVFVVHCAGDVKNELFYFKLNFVRVEMENLRSVRVDTPVYKLFFNWIIFIQERKTQPLERN